MPRRLVTPTLAARYRASLVALSAAHEGAGTGRPDWWQGVADAHRQVADALDALGAGLAGALSFDAPQYVLREIVARAASEHTIKARDAAERQADADARRASADQDRAFASNADNIAAAAA